MYCQIWSLCKLDLFLLNRFKNWRSRHSMQNRTTYPAETELRRSHDNQRKNQKLFKHFSPGSRLACSENGMERKNKQSAVRRSAGSAELAGCGR
jgi:hypothetical protein